MEMAGQLPLLKKIGEQMGEFVNESLSLDKPTKGS